MAISRSRFSFAKHCDISSSRRIVRVVRVVGVSRIEEQWGQANEGRLTLHRTKPHDRHMGVYVDKSWCRAGRPKSMSKYVK